LSNGRSERPLKRPSQSEKEKAPAIQPGLFLFSQPPYPFHLGPWFGRTILRPVVEFAFLYVRWKHHLEMQQVSPQDTVAAAITAAPSAQLRKNSTSVS